MDEQTLMAINAYPNFQDDHVLLISPAVISSSFSKKAVSKNKKEVNEDPSNGWLFLPTELLNLIMTRLTSMADFSTFRSVCPTWRSLASPCPENLAYQSPLLLLASPKKDTLGLYDFTRKSLYNIRLSIRTQQDPEEPYCIDDYTCLSYSQGFLVIADMPGYTEIMLYNIFTGNRIMLPAITRSNSCNLQFIFSSSPASPGCLVVMFRRGRSSFHFCCVGDDQWKCHCLNGFSLINDMLFFYGKLYAITYQKQLISIGFGCCLEQILIEKEEELANNILDRSGVPSLWRFAQSRSELLLVRRYLKSQKRLCIYRWDFGASALTEVSSLGGRALFFNNFFMASVPPTSFGVRPNCIYFFSPHPAGLRKKGIIWYEFSMEDGTIRKVCHEPPCPELSSSVTWILPSMS